MENANGFRTKIDGRTYDTTTAKLIRYVPFGDKWGVGHYEISLYKKKNGEYFYYTNGGVPGHWREEIIPATETEAKNWLEVYEKASSEREPRW